MHKPPFLRTSVAAVAHTLTLSVILSTHASSARAQEAAPAAQPMERVVITGSNIKRIDTETATPVQVVRREEISRLGVNSVRQLIETLTASSNSSLSDVSGSNSFAGGASSAELRNLGKQSTLVLLNSRRVAPYALADYNEVFTNLDTLPLDAIDRIEVLRSGGSSIYGSDAVAGVINIITRANYEGISGRASHQESIEHGGYHEWKASLTGGFGNLASDRYNVLANVEVYRRSSIMWRQLVDDINPGYGQRFASVRNGSGLMFGNRGAPSTFSFPGNLIGQGPLPGCATLNGAGLCVYDRYSRFEAQPAAERANALVSGRLRISDSTEGFAEVLYSNTKTTYQSPSATYDSTAGTAVWGNPVTGTARTFEYGPLPSTHPLNTSGEDLDLRYRFADMPGRSVSDSTQYRVLAGLRGNYGKYDWESALGIMGGRTKDRSRGGYLSVSGFAETVGAAGYNDDGSIRDPQFFNRGYRLGQINSPDVLSVLFPEAGYDGRVTQTFWDAKISGEVAQWRGRPVLMALGADVRHEKFRISPTANLLAGDIVNNGVSSANASRTNYSAFAEGEVPLSPALNLTAAARVDKFPGFSAHVSPKLALRFEASKKLMLRGTVETGFRAPNLTESAQSSKFSFDNETADPRRCPAAQAYAEDLRTQSDNLPETDPLKALAAAKADSVESNECTGGIVNFVRNNPNLKPELSRSATVGFVVEPAPGYNLSVDYWTIKRRDEINLKSNDELLAGEAQQAPGVILRRPLAQESSFTSINGQESTAAIQQRYGMTVGAISTINGMFLNVSKTKTSGFDLGASARIPTSIGRLDLTLNATRLLELRNYFSERDGGSYGDNLAGRYGYSKTVANFTGVLQTGYFTNSLRFVWNSPTTLKKDYVDVGSYDEAGCAERGWTARECRVASSVRTDYNLSYTGIRNLTIGLNIHNVFDRRPPLDLRSFAEAGQSVIPQNIDDVLGRVVRVTLEYKFK